MTNLFVNLPVPSSNAPGAAVDVSAMGKTKTIILGGTLNAAVTIEYATDAAGTDFAPITTFQPGSNSSLTTDVAAHWMRAVTSGYKGGAGNCDVGGSDAGSSFVQVPSGGAPVDISALPLFKTVVAAPGFSGNIEVTQDGVSWAQVMTFQNGGGQSGSFYGAEARIGGGGGGVVWMGGAEIGDGSGQQPFPPVPAEIVVYARSSGDDATGNGSLASPYRTFARAIRDVPSIIPSGQVWKVDITGSSTLATPEVLPDMYEFPVFIAAQGVGDFDFAEQYFYYYGPVNVLAEPQPATGVAGILTVPIGSVETYPTASTELVAITSATPTGWVNGQLKGKFAISSGVATEHCVIYDNVGDTLFLTRARPATPTPTPAMTLPIQIMECGAHLTAGKDPNNLHRGAVNILNSQVVLGGIKVSSSDGPDGAFSNWGLQVGGTTPPESLMLCELPGVGLTAESWVRTRACYLEDVLFLMAPLSMTQCYLRNSFNTGIPSSVAPSLRITVWGCRGLDSMIRRCVIEGLTPLFERDLFDQGNGGAVGILDIDHTQFIDMITQQPGAGVGAFPIPFVIGEGVNPFWGDMDGPINSAIYWTGGNCYLQGVDIKNTAPRAAVPGASGSAIMVRGGNSIMQLRSVTSSGSLYPNVGAEAIDGGAIQVNDTPTQLPVPPGPPTSIAGTLGAYKSGSNVAVAAWPGAPFNAPDFTGGFAQGARIFQK